ncbi:MAG: response regulator [Gallionella sp.]|jgi:two-component system chemotaxis sensor kinase CheA
MTNQNDEFLQRLLVTFRGEANEHLQMMSAGLIELENNPVAVRYAEIVENVFREAHSLKGAARAVNLKEIASLCQSLEGVLAALKGGQLAISAQLFDLMQEAIDDLSKLIIADMGRIADSGKAAIATLSRRLDDALHGKFVQSVASQFSASRPVQSSLPVQQTPSSSPSGANAPLPMPPAYPGLASETVRVSTRKLDAVMRQVEELLTPQLASTQRAGELREVAATFVTWKKQRARMRPALRQIERYIEGGVRNNGVVRELTKFPAQELAKLLEHLETESLFMKTLEERLLRMSKFAAHDRRTLAGMSESLLHDVKEMHLLPFSSLLETFPRFTRELAREQGKQVELVIRGSEIELDRRTLEEMKDPLMHLLRNCIDHGIEPPTLRRDKGKPEHGAITIAIAQKDGGKIEILVADDGAGIDVAKVRAAACKLGIISGDRVEQLSSQEAQELVFQSGISTSPIITDISGRGLGLAIVLEKVERLGGVISLESRHDSGVQHSGTSFFITLPLMLATFRGVLVRAGEYHFVIPALSVERVARVAQQDIRTVENRATISLGGQAVALVSLGEVLELPRKSTTVTEQVQVVVLGAGHKHVAFRVDEIIGEQEVLVKTLGPQLARVRNIAGASVLGTGKVVAVLNVPDLLKSAAKQSAPPIVAAETQGTAKKLSILVVEDSITSRALLKNILESAGYLVTTAVDGVDAYTTLKTGTFDLIVSDVEMPRMDGFDLTAKVRADKRLAELPVVLVTALESSVHRERGIDVGANAYIVKSSFDQSNLLEVIRRLI